MTSCSFMYLITYIYEDGLMDVYSLGFNPVLVFILLLKLFHFWPLGAKHFYINYLLNPPTIQ